MAKVNRPLRALGLQRPFLHAFRLSFEHPMREGERDRRVTVQAPLASDLAAFLRAAGLGELSAAADAEISREGE